MKFSLSRFQLKAVFLLAVLSAGVITLIQSARAPAFCFEVSMHTSAGGMTQTFYDMGWGINESDSVRLPLRDAEAAVVYRFPLAEAEYRSFRFDPIDHGNADLVIDYVRIVDLFGHTVREFPLQELAGAKGTSGSDIKDGKLFLTLGPGDNDSTLTINPGGPLALRAAFSSRLLFASRTFLFSFLPFVLAGLLGLALVKRLWSSGVRRRWSVAWLPKGRLIVVLVFAAFSAAFATLTYWEPPSFQLEVSMRSSTAGIARVFYDVGRGINETDSVSLPLSRTESPVVYQFPLPDAEYQSFRFDPLDRGNADIIINRVRVVDMFGSSVRNFSLKELKVGEGTSGSQIDAGKISLTLGPADDDSNLLINSGAPLALYPALSSRLLFGARSFLLYFLPLAIAGLLGLFLARRLWPGRIQEGWLESLFPKFQLTAVFFLAALLAGAVALTQWALTPPFYFEVSMRSSKVGLAQTFYDIGRGIDEPDSARLSVRDTKSMAVYRFPLPAAEYRVFRFDPLDQVNAEIVIGYLRIVDMYGDTVRNFPLRDLRLAHGISRSEIKGGQLFLTLGPSDEDSALVMHPDTPMALQPAFSRRLLVATDTFLLYFFPLVTGGLLWLILAKRLWSSRWQQRWSSTASLVHLHPRRALLLMAVISTVISCYPVIFFGKSFVSPNNGALLLYDRLPTLPGYTSSIQDNPRGADLGASAWLHVPSTVVESRAIFHDFELPLWNRYNSSGIALLGQGQSMVGDPLHTIVLMAKGAAWSWDLKFVLAKILFAWGIGLTILAATRHLPSAMILAGSSVFIGFFAYRYNHAAIFSVCYSPWILYCWFRIREAPTIKKTVPWIVGLMAASWSEMTSGTVKEAYILLLGMNACGLLVFLLGTGSHSLKFQKSVHLTIGALLFALISTPVWLTFLDTLSLAYTSYIVPDAWQIQPSLLLGIFDDLFYTGFIPGGGGLAPSTNFLVLLGILLALGHFRTLLSDPAFRAVGISALISAALVFGIVPPGLIATIPFIGNVVHIHNTFSCVLIIHLILLAAFGLRAFWQQANSNTWKVNARVTFTILALLLSLYLGFVQAADSVQHPLLHSHEIVAGHFFVGYALSLLFALIALPFVLRSILQSPAKGLLLAPLVLVCLIAFHWRFGMYLSGPFDKYVMNPQVRVNLAADSPAIRLVRENQQPPSRTIGLGNNLMAGFNAALRIEGINGADALINVYFRQLTEAWWMQREWDWRYIIRSENLARAKTLCDLLNVKYYLAPSSQQSVAGLEPVSQLDLAVHKSNSVWPRAFYTDTLSSYETLSEFTSMITAGDGRPFAAVARNDFGQTLPFAQANSAVPRDRKVVAADGYRLTSNTTSFRIAAPKAGVIVLTEAYLPNDFRLEVNGIPARYFRVNHAFKGIIIDRPGDYSVTFSYWPRRFTLSLWLSLFGTLALLFYVGRNCFRSETARLRV